MNLCLLTMNFWTLNCFLYHILGEQCSKHLPSNILVHQSIYDCIRYVCACICKHINTQSMKQSIHECMCVCLKSWNPRIGGSTKQSISISSIRCPCDQFVWSCPFKLSFHFYHPCCCPCFCLVWGLILSEHKVGQRRSRSLWCTVRIAQKSHDCSQFPHSLWPLLL